MKRVLEGYFDYCLVVSFFRVFSAQNIMAEGLSQIGLIDHFFTYLEGAFGALLMIAFFLSALLATLVAVEKKLETGLNRSSIFYIFSSYIYRKKSGSSLF